jgi:outer membrane protein TolC
MTKPLYRIRLISCGFNELAALVIAGAYWIAAIPLPAQQFVAKPEQAAEKTVHALSLHDAIEQAQRSEPLFAQAAAASKVAEQNKSIARSALLPNVGYHNQYLYTEGARGSTGSANASAGTASAGTPRFIGNNAVHEYASQGVVTEVIGAQQFKAVASAKAESVIALAELEIARRGLVSTVIALYYGSVAADRKVAIAERAMTEATDFAKSTRLREEGREAAHADVVKAELQKQQRDRDLSDARLQSEKSRLELAVLVYADPHTSFKLSAAASPAPMQSREEVEAVAARNNPELKSAFASLDAASLNVTGARAAYLPELGLNFTYGIDAPEFAVHAPDGTRNLGYAASATLDIPVWDWFATHSRVKQSVALREAARVQLSATQRQMIARIDEDYDEARVAQEQLQSFETSVQMARESLKLARLRYSAGETNVLEVVDAQSSLAAQENAREDGIVRYHSALAQLQLLTGQGVMN